MSSDEPDNSLAVEAVASFVVAAGATALGSVDPSAAVLATGLGAAFTTVMPKALETAKQRIFRRFAKSVEAGVESSGSPLTEILIAGDQDPFRQQLTADMLEASAKTPLDQKLIALGRAWANGVLSNDDAVLAREQQFVRSLARLEYPHLRVLDVIRGDFTQVPQGLALVDGWTAEAVRSQLPQYGDLVLQLISVLVSEGLIANQTIQNPMVPGMQFRITAAGEDLVARVEDASLQVNDKL